MPKKLQAFTLTILALLALLFVACSGAKGTSDDKEPRADGNDGPDVFSDLGGNDDLFVSSAADVLGASASQFEREITSMEGDFEMYMSAGSVGEISVDGKFGFQLPYSMYMSMVMDGDDGSGIDIGEFGSFDMLMRDETMYIKNALFGPQWVAMPLDEAQVDITEMEAMLNDGSPFDYSGLVDGIDGIEFVGEETIEGRVLVHYRVSMDAADVMDTFRDALDSSVTGITDSYSDVSGPINVDIWLGKSDFLPYLMTMDMEVTSATEGALSMEMTMRITGYNGNVNIPDAPSDSISMEEAFGGLFGDLTDENAWGDFTDSD